MDGLKLINSIRLENFLSFGPNKTSFPLEPLNVLIGPNASGKSNLIKALSVLQAAPRDLQTPIRQGGGVRDWIWKGTAETPTATIEVTTPNPNGPVPLRYRLSFTETAGQFQLRDEVVENEIPLEGNAIPYFFYQFAQGRPVLNFRAVTEDRRYERHLVREDEISVEQSILSQRRDPDSYPELFWLASLFGLIGIYGEWDLGSRSPARLPQQADLPRSTLSSDGSNLSLVLNRLLNDQAIVGLLLKRMRDFYPALSLMTTEVNGGVVQTLFHESGLSKPIPATRISDGSLRYLCQLALLCDSDRSLHLTCIEEPETGLHPDMIPEMASLLEEASSRGQIFVTTHSDALVDALTHIPEAVIVCEKVEGATQLRRLDGDELKPWLEQYRLGELWTRGRFGGNRW